MHEVSNNILVGCGIEIRDALIDRQLIISRFSVKVSRYSIGFLFLLLTNYIWTPTPAASHVGLLATHPHTDCLHTLQEEGEETLALCKSSSSLHFWEITSLRELKKLLFLVGKWTSWQDCIYDNVLIQNVHRKEGLSGCSFVIFVREKGSEQISAVCVAPQ